MNRFNEFIDLLKLLIRQPSVVGAEHAFFRILQRELEERGATVTWYEGLLVAQGNAPDSAMFSAHIDRHGLTCTGPNEFQFAAFVAGNRSDLLGNSVSEKLMTKIIDRYDDTSVIAYEPWTGMYLGKGVINSSYICEFRNNLIFNILGLEHVLAGTPIAFVDALKIQNDIISAQLDNVLTAALLVHLFSLGFQGTAFFTAQEETGSSWRYLLEWFRRFGGTTNQLIVVDTSPYPDEISRDKQKVVLRKQDANAKFNIETTLKIEKLCQQLNIDYSFKDEYIIQQNMLAKAQGKDAQSLGSTELGRITAASNGLVHGTTLQIPTTNYHTMNEATTIASCTAFLELLLAISNNH